MLKIGTTFLAAAALLASASCAAHSQTSGQTTEQTVFELEGKVNNSVGIPVDVIAMLKSEEVVDGCFRTEGAGTNEEAWFEAAEIDLNGDDRSDLIVKPKHPCLYGANQGPFWIFQNAPDGYQKVLSASGLSLKVLPQKASSFNDIEVSRVVAMKPQATRFAFSQGKYRPAK